MGGNISGNLKGFTEYIEASQRCTELMQEQQKNVERTYLELRKSWCDNIYLDMGKTFYNLSLYNKKIYDKVRSLLFSTVKYRDKYIEIQKILDAKVLRKEIEEYRIGMTEGDFTMSNIYDKNIKTDLDAMKRYIESISKYISATKENLAKLRGSCNSWNSSQTQELQQVLRSISQKIEIEIEDLNNKNKELNKKWEALDLLNRMGL